MFKLVLLVLLICGINCQQPKVEILYESLCPDSFDFITQQLHPVFDEIAPYVDLKLTPFGKSASLANGEFVCQHGPQECKGNRIQSCVLNEIQDQKLQVQYVNCFMNDFKKGRRNEQEFGQACASAVGADLNNLSRCFSSTTGTQLQLLAEESTKKIAPKFVPTILFNGQFDQELQDSSLTDFRGVICGIITPAYPDACKNPKILRL